MASRILFWTMVNFLIFVPFSFSQNRPFPQQIEFPNSIKPNHLSQVELDNTVSSFFDYWKLKYLKPSNGGTPGGGFYVEMQGTGGNGQEITTSEAHGFGMLIFVLMAGYDTEAKNIYDGFYNMYDKHRSTGDNDLMSWVIHSSENSNNDAASATDGDLDIAYSLILAHYQWGSAGTINYLDEAKRIITQGIKASTVHATSYRTMLGDWDRNQWTTRSSDWMTGHFQAFYQVTQDDFWNTTFNTAYQLIDNIIQNYSPNTGLMPDFIVNQTPRPADPGFLESPNDGDYNWNACRYPWRITTDYLHYGSAEAKLALENLVSWVETKTGGDPSLIKAGYQLNGNELVNYTSNAFTAPMITAATIDATHQQFLNQGWDLISNVKVNYYADTITLLTMLLITGNWWKPDNQLPIVYRNYSFPISKGILSTELYDLKGKFISFHSADRVPDLPRGYFLIKEPVFNK